MTEWTDDVVTAPEAARLKGVAESSIRRAIQKGRLPGLRKGHIYFVRRSDLERWQPIGHRPRRGAPGSVPRSAAGRRFPDREAPGEVAFPGPRSLNAGSQPASRHRGAARAARIEALQEEFADLGISTQGFLSAKQEDIEWEEQSQIAERDGCAGRQRIDCPRQE